MLKLFTAYVSNKRIDAYKECIQLPKRWNGVEVSNQSIYVPNTYDLKSGK